MNGKVRLWLSQFLAGVIMLASGLTGYVAYGSHDDYIEIGHVLGTHGGHHHDLDWPQANGNRIQVPLCQFEGSCHQDESQHAVGHVHVNTSGPLAIAPGDIELPLSVASAALNFDLGSRSAPRQLFYPLLKPPRASA